MDYRLDLDTLLLMLGQSTGSLYSEFQHIPEVKRRCRVFLYLERGVVKNCTIADERGGEIASGATALKLIQNQVLEWHYTESQSLPVPKQTTSHSPALRMPQRQALTGPLRPPVAPVLRSPIPRRTSHVPQDEFLLWPRLYRSVYSLIDGKVSVEHIVRLLAREQDAGRVREVLLYLQQAGLITLT